MKRTVLDALGQMGFHRNEVEVVLRRMGLDPHTEEDPIVVKNVLAHLSTMSPEPMHESKGFAKRIEELAEKYEAESREDGGWQNASTTGTVEAKRTLARVASELRKALIEDPKP